MGFFFAGGRLERYFFPFFAFFWEYLQIVRAATFGAFPTHITHWYLLSLHWKRHFSIQGADASPSLLHRDTRWHVLRGLTRSRSRWESQRKMLLIFQDLDVADLSKLGDFCREMGFVAYLIANSRRGHLKRRNSSQQKEESGGNTSTVFNSSALVALWEICNRMKNRHRT